MSKFSKKKKKQDIKSQEGIPQTLNTNYSYDWETCIFLFSVTHTKPGEKESKVGRNETITGEVTEHGLSQSCSGGGRGQGRASGPLVPPCLTCPSSSWKDPLSFSSQEHPVQLWGLQRGSLVDLGRGEGENQREGA